MPRLETRWFIDVYKKKEDMNNQLLEFAKLDFNMVQATLQEDVKYASKWWKKLGLGEITMSFARDRLVENFLWTIGIIYEPQFAYCRRQIAQINCLLTTIDDAYNVYGSFEELKHFTYAVERWDIKAVEKLPHCMKICFLALYNNTNQMAYDIMKEQGVDISILLILSYFRAPSTFLGRCMKSIPGRGPMDEIVRGDVQKSIQCYMHDTGTSEESARKYIQDLIGKTWKKKNKERVGDSHLPQPFINAAVGLARMAQCMYQYGDGHGVPDRETKDRVNTLLIESI
ncbi:hypothetical protein GIB67_027426 [Kingdonia uniflora]|uniref:Terpene synthase metal-binding domain-containing protein n=1 Tax=Kingdonia uniflora TaxID=39325 RepID=A0A7J7MF58_9MAGN|nr:hypothetical protein GIB67_027426 [Kingdonia uniflora]